MKPSSALHRAPTRAEYLVGSVVGFAEGPRPVAGGPTRPSFRVHSGDLEVVAKPASGCLVLPRAGDRILVAVAEEGAWILSVLDSAESGTHMFVEGDVVLESGGTLNLRSRKDLNLEAKDSVSLAGKSGAFRFGELGVLASKIVGHALETRWTSEVAEGLFGRAVSRMRRAFRVVEEMDHLRAAQIDYSATGAIALRADTTTVTAARVVKLDAGQIVVG